MNRTKWMRLSVRDLGDVIRWAGAQNAREIGEFRYRVVNGREIVSFRLVPRYAIDVGAREIIVVAYAGMIGWRQRWREIGRIARAAVRHLKEQAGIAAAVSSPLASLPPHRIADLRPGPALREQRIQPL